MSDFIHKYLPSSGVDSTLLLLHEAGATENDLIPIGLAVAKGSALLSPRLPDRYDPEACAHEIADFVTRSAERLGFDAKRVFALGYSSGAELAAAVIMLYPRLLAGAILMRGRMPVTMETLPDLHEMPIIILAGQQDAVAPPGDTDLLARTLTLSSAAVEVHWLSEGHDLGPDDFRRAMAWMRGR